MVREITDRVGMRWTVEQQGPFGSGPLNRAGFPGGSGERGAVQGLTWVR
jgi:hypothetical protein